jgi:transposase
MMGRLEAGQERLFYRFRLEDQVPANHLLRKLDALLDLDIVRKQLEPSYSEIGRPSVDPELMIRMLLIGYCYSIRSERRLCDEVRFNLAYRWFCGLGLEAAVPHPSTFSVNRHGRFRENAALRLVFESVVATCMKVGLVGGEGFAVDASVVKADASRYQRVEGSEVDWSDEQKAQRPVREYLAALESENSPVKAISPSDPAAAWTTRVRHKVQFAYSVNHLVDLSNGVIVDVAATPTRISMEVDVVETMLDRVAARFDLKPTRITADVAYGKDGSNAQQVDQLIAQSAAVRDAQLSQLWAKEVEAAEKVRAANERVAAGLEAERGALMQTERERFVAQALSRLSAEATAQQRHAVEQLAGALFDEQQVLQARQRLMDEGRSVIDRARTATEQHAAEVQKLNELLSSGAIDQASYARAVEDANDRALRSSQAWTHGATRFLKDYVAESNDAANRHGARVRKCFQQRRGRTGRVHQHRQAGVPESRRQHPCRPGADDGASDAHRPARRRSAERVRRRRPVRPVARGRHRG